MLEKRELSPIGIGTFRVNLQDKSNTMRGLLYSHENGQNYIDTSFIYENGKVLEFLSDFFKEVDREKIFISTKLEKYIEKSKDVEEQLDKYLKLMNLEYVDCVQLHASFVTKLPLLETYYEMNKLVKKGKVRYLGISNCSYDELIELNNNHKQFNFEGVYNLECKLYEDNKVIEYCKQNDIDFVCYQPLRRNRTAMRKYPLLVEFSNKYNKTQNQILLNWIIKEKRLRPILKTTNIDKIAENLAALNFNMEQEDIKRLNDFRSSEFDSVNIDWKAAGGVTIDQLANQFE